MIRSPQTLPHEVGGRAFSAHKREQVLWFIGLLEVPFLLKLRDGSVDGTGDLGFDPLGLKEDSEAFAYNQARHAQHRPFRFPLPAALLARSSPPVRVLSSQQLC
jgi:hypothetical protein